MKQVAAVLFVFLFLLTSISFANRPECPFGVLTWRTICVKCADGGTTGRPLSKEIHQVAVVAYQWNELWKRCDPLPADWQTESTGACGSCNSAHLNNEMSCALALE
jgi:hypothetical protein